MFPGPGWPTARKRSMKKIFTFFVLHKWSDSPVENGRLSVNEIASFGRIADGEQFVN